MNPKMDFDAWFEKATGNAPYPYQKRFATEESLPQFGGRPEGDGEESDGLFTFEDMDVLNH